MKFIPNIECSPPPPPFWSEMGDLNRKITMGRPHLLRPSPSSDLSVLKPWICMFRRLAPCLALPCLTSWYSTVLIVTLGKSETYKETIKEKSTILPYSIHKRIHVRPQRNLIQGIHVNTIQRHTVRYSYSLGGWVQLVTVGCNLPPGHPQPGPQVAGATSRGTVGATLVYCITPHLVRVRYSTGRRSLVWHKVRVQYKV